MKIILCVVAATLLLSAQTPDKAVVVNSREAKWQHDADDPPGGESLVLRMDRQTGGMEFFARYPAGFAFKTHSHKANERFLLLEGQATVETNGSKTMIEAGGFAYFPAGQQHSITCGTKTKCAWYLQWDKKP